MTVPSRPRAPLAYLWGDDGYGLEAAAETIRRDPGRFPEGEPERWRLRVDAANAPASLGELRERLGTGSMFGTGVLAVLTGAGVLARRNEDKAAVLEAIALMAPGNGLVVIEETESGKKAPPQAWLADAISAGGGEVRAFAAPREGALAAWLEARARERGLALGPGAAKELATRVGGFVREGDVDRRQQGRIAVNELEKLSLLRGTDPITVADVQALVAEAVPGSVWAFVDAVGLRQRRRAIDGLERLLETTPEPVLLSVLHRRIRELLEVADRLASGETPGSLVRSMKLQPFRAETLSRQAQTWSLDELEAALAGLLDLDASVKGVGGRGSGPSGMRLAFDLWIVERVAPQG